MQTSVDYKFDSPFLTGPLEALMPTPYITCCLTSAMYTLPENIPIFRELCKKAQHHLHGNALPQSIAIAISGF